MSLPPIDSIFSKKQRANLNIIKAAGRVDRYGWLLPIDADWFGNWSVQISDSVFTYTGVDMDVMCKISVEEFSQNPAEWGYSCSWISSNHWRALVKFGKFEDSPGRLCLYEAFVPAERVQRQPLKRTSCAYWQMVFFSMVGTYVACKTDQAVPSFVLPTNN